MPIRIYLACPDADVSTADEYLQAAKSKFPWINFDIQKWPCEGKFKSGITGTIYSDEAENLAIWASTALKPPAVVIVDQALCYGGNVPITGLTHQKTPLSVIPTVFQGGNKIPIDVTGKTLLHELLHMARNMKGRLADLNEERHCLEPSCALNHAGGRSESDLVTKIRLRSDQPCATCAAVLNEIEESGEWS